MLDRGDRNTDIVNRFFANPDLRQMVIDYWMSSYDQFRTGSR